MPQVAGRVDLVTEIANLLAALEPDASSSSSSTHHQPRQHPAASVVLMESRLPVWDEAHELLVITEASGAFRDLNFGGVEVASDAEESNASEL